MFRLPMQARKDQPLNLCAVLVPLLCKEGRGEVESAAPLPHPTSPYKREEKASGEGVTPVREQSRLEPPEVPFALSRRGSFAPSRRLL